MQTDSLEGLKGEENKEEQYQGGIVVISKNRTFLELPKNTSEPPARDKTPDYHLDKRNDYQINLNTLQNAAGIDMAV